MKCPGVHDLVRLAPPALLKLATEADEEGMDWVEESLNLAPWAVVRRARPSSSQRVSVGVRGAQRNQRWAAEVDMDDIMETIPVDATLAYPVRRSHLPAFQALTELRTTMPPLPWGPGGSVGFELTTGLESAHSGSDVDLIVYATQPLVEETILHLGDITRQAMESSGVHIDILVETPSGAVAFAELARTVGLPSIPTLMLRTSEGPALVHNPWS